jgi:NhaA family Na+:H+ antiporter
VPLLDVSLADVLHPVPLGIMGGLFLGKFIGILGMSSLAVGIRAARLPKDVTWRQLQGVALLCGVGFTMSLFIASLAFEQGGEAYFGLDRLGILMGSLLSGVLGYLWLRLSLRGTPGRATR